MKGGGSRSSRRKVLQDYTGGLGGKRSPIQSDDCSKITFTIRLSNVTDAVKSTKIGDTLRLQSEGNSIVAKNPRGGTCGYIASAHNADLLSCMKKGRTFIAKVLEASKDVCKVRVQIDS